MSIIKTDNFTAEELKSMLCRGDLAISDLDITALYKLIDCFYKEGDDLRRLTERELPRLAGKLDVEDGSYYELLIAHCEQLAKGKSLERMKIYKDTELIELLK